VPYSNAISTSFLFAVLAINPAKSSSLTANMQTDGGQLVREVIENEIRAQLNDKNLWSYRELTKRNGKELLREYCQTQYGSIHRLLAVNGRMLDANQRQAEDKRLQRLIKSAGAVRAVQRKEAGDAQKERSFLRLFPDAFRYQEVDQEGDRMKLRFTPNPSFHPSGNEARVLHCLEGTIVVDIKQKRLVSVNGRLMRQVEFWGGLLGHLNPGGTFSVVSENVAPGDWELKSLDIEMNGKALLFKTLTVREQDSFTNYTPVSSDTTLQQATARLGNDSWTAKSANIQRPVPRKSGI
jgi:hypothetical protein